MVVSTNAADHLSELDQLLVAAGRDTGLDLRRPGFRLTFLLDDMSEALLEDVFGAVETVHARGTLAITDAEVVANYIGLTVMARSRCTPMPGSSSHVPERGKVRVIPARPEACSSA